MTGTADLHSPRLPIEVIERIIDSVHELQYEHTGGWFRDLYTIWKACSLTCRAMVPRSQFWLFREIALITEKQALKLVGILRKNATIGRHVRSLEISGPSALPGIPNPWGDNMLKRNSRCTWISWISPVLAPSMKNLQQLRLTHDLFLNCHPQLPQTLTAFKSIRTLILFSVPFSDPGQCVRLVRAFPHLRHLSLDNLTWEAKPPNSQPLRNWSRQGSQRKRVELARLNLLNEDSTVRMFTKWLLGIEATGSLVTFIGYPEQHEILRKLIFPSESSIRSMALHSQLDVSIQIPDHSLDNLQTMHVMMEDDTFPARLLTSIAQAASPQIRKLTVYLRVKMYFSEDSEKPTITEDERAAYATLDAALCKLILHGLRLTLCVYNEKVPIEIADLWQRKLVGVLPKFCSEEGKLVTRRIFSRLPLVRWIKERDGF